MKKFKHFRLLILILISGFALYLAKPKNAGATYSPYFASLNKELKAKGPGRPILVVDLDLLDSNIAELKRHIHTPKHFRAVDKSLPSFSLMDYIMSKTGTKRVMCFHQPYLNAWVRHQPGVDLLLGKPMPINAVKTFYKNLPDSTDFNPSTQLQWLIDSKERLVQYQQFAIQENLHLQINLEIDVGLHRGGLQKPEDLEIILTTIQNDDTHLSFTGFMGYDAHIPEIFFPLGSTENALKEVQQKYADFVRYGKANFPKLFLKPLTFNGAGSKTYQLYDSDTLLNDISSGSGLLLPSDFDLPTLRNHRPAVYIATPILKKINGINIPFLEFLSPLMRWWNPNLEVTYFMYGGRWKAKHFEPRGLSENALYGFSSNQQIANGSAATLLNVDDYIFLRPTQTEAVMLEFGDIYILRGGKIKGQWKVFEQ